MLLPHASLVDITGSGHATVSIEVVPFENHEDVLDGDRMKHIWTKLLRTLHKHGLGTSTGYKKRVHHDVLVPKVPFQDTYAVLKEKYRGWVETWKEETDPHKHVFEDVAIAAWLIVLWEMERRVLGMQRKQTFVDVGCGNGFLTYILTNEGYTGYGVDITARKSWEMYTNTQLDVAAIHPMKTTYKDVDWIIGNHPDELTMWIPVVAARSGYNKRFVIIPCCFHDFSGARMTKEQLSHGLVDDVDDRSPFLHRNWKKHSTPQPLQTSNSDTLEDDATPDSKSGSKPGKAGGKGETGTGGSAGRYQLYLDRVEDVCVACGYIPEREHLRIPSTKNVAIVGRWRTFSGGLHHSPLPSELVDVCGVLERCWGKGKVVSEGGVVADEDSEKGGEADEDVVDRVNQLALEKGVAFVARISDREKDQIRRMKQKAKQQKQVCGEEAGGDADADADADANSDGDGAGWVDVFDEMSL
ncbi:tRNA methyltransferase 44 [Quaeritorhiza haematococci]|nr:tRNA methyltransferase 44 [Quaeritorhiza haematococci]